MEDISLEWVVSQPLGIAVLIVLVAGFVTGRVVTGAALRREQDRADRLAETVATLSAAVEKSAETTEKSLEVARLVHALIQGIDSTLRNQRGQ